VGIPSGDPASNSRSLLAVEAGSQPDAEALKTSRRWHLSDHEAPTGAPLGLPSSRGREDFLDEIASRTRVLVARAERLLTRRRSARAADAAFRQMSSIRMDGGVGALGDRRGVGTPARRRGCAGTLPRRFFVRFEGRIEVNRAFDLRLVNLALIAAWLGHQPSSRSPRTIGGPDDHQIDPG
jgi:hypothetical protein